MTQITTPAAPVEADGQLDDALDDTFPASDPPSQTDPTHGIRTAPAFPPEEAVRQRAYEIWEQSGYAHGNDEAHWEQARQEVLAGMESSGVG